MPDYRIWTFHSEEVPYVYSGEHDGRFPSSSMVDHTFEMNQATYIEEMLNNALGQHASFDEADDSRLEESPNEFTRRFYNLLAEANEPVFEGVTESKLSVCIRLGQHASFDEADDIRLKESPNEFTQRFYNLLAEANEPVFEGVTESKLSICIRLLSFKSNWNIPNQALDNIAKLILDLVGFEEQKSKTTK